MESRKVEVGATFGTIPYFEVQVWAETKGYYNNICEHNEKYFVYQDDNGNFHKKYWNTKLTIEDVKAIKALHKRNHENVVRKAKEGDELCIAFLRRCGEWTI